MVQRLLQRYPINLVGRERVISDLEVADPAFEQRASDKQATHGTAAPPGVALASFEKADWLSERSTALTT
jgi:hypothetical protein